MSFAIFAGAACGIATVGLSEWFLLRWIPRLNLPATTLSLVGLMLRSAWVLACMIAGMRSGVVEPKPFVLSLLVCYFAGLMFEARRYQNYFSRR